jgi:hypothetical protein
MQELRWSGIFAFTELHVCLAQMDWYENGLSELTDCFSLWSLFKCFSRLG